MGFYFSSSWVFQVLSLLSFHVDLCLSGDHDDHGRKSAICVLLVHVLDGHVHDRDHVRDHGLDRDHDLALCLDETALLGEGIFDLFDHFVVLLILFLVVTLVLIVTPSLVVIPVPIVTPSLAATPFLVVTLVLIVTPSLGVTPVLIVIPCQIENPFLVLSFLHLFLVLLLLLPFFLVLSPFPSPLLSFSLPFFLLFSLLLLFFRQFDPRPCVSLLPLPQQRFSKLLHHNPKEALLFRELQFWH